MEVQAATGMIVLDLLKPGRSGRIGIASSGERRYVDIGRSIGKSNMRSNSALPKTEVDPQPFVVFDDRELLNYEPAVVLPVTQLYYLLLKVCCELCHGTSVTS
ncbi:hypothetical protein I1E95_16520 [Synechococcus sp. CBW1107]|nr:hypothetical protein [Synechococcus sp. CBW1107]QPN56629.1 hypothetical protein I1E95_16520 [Synechococcus sp. CBW1107]